MQQGNLKSEKQFGTKSVKVDLQVLIFEEDNIHYAYMPSFDLMGYGNTKGNAKESLTEQLKDIVNSKQYTSSNYQINIPALA